MRESRPDRSEPFNFAHWMALDEQRPPGMDETVWQNELWALNASLEKSDDRDSILKEFKSKHQIH